MVASVAPFLSPFSVYLCCATDSLRHGLVYEAFHIKVRIASVTQETKYAQQKSAIAVSLPDIAI